MQTRQLTARWNRLIHARRCLVVTAALCLPSSVPAQVRTVTMPKPIAEHPEALTDPVGVRELADGRVLVSDMGEQMVLILDFARQAAVPAAKQGAGPLEFRTPGQLFVLGDNVVMPDAMLRRLLVFGPDGKPLRTMAMTPNAGDIMAFVKLGRVLGTDRTGRVYSEARGMTVVPGKMPTMSDTAALVRWTTLGEKGDTLATRFEHTEMPAMQGDPAKGIRMTIRMDALTPRDVWEVFPDGRAVVLRIADYHAEVHEADGKRTVAARVPFQPVPLTPRDRERLVKEARETYERGLKLGMSMAASASPGGLPKIDFDIQEPAEWPKARPAFTGAVAAPDGSLWVARTMPALGEPADYDVLDTKGRLVRRIRFPASVAVIAFGKGVVYAVRKDEDDLKYVQRYRMP